MKKWILLAIVAITLSFSKDNVEGIASYYAKKFEGRRTATGEKYRAKEFTAASNCFDLNTTVEVRNKRNDSIIVVRINDRMHPSMNRKGRIIDLSYNAAKALDMINKGLTTVIIKKL